MLSARCQPLRPAGTAVPRSSPTCAGAACAWSRVREFTAGPDARPGSAARDVAADPSGSRREERTGGRSAAGETPTTFGPVGRSVITAVLLAWIVERLITTFVLSLGCSSLRRRVDPQEVLAEGMGTDRARSSSPAHRSTVPAPTTAPAPTVASRCGRRSRGVGLGVVFLGAALGFAYGRVRAVGRC